MSLLGKLTGTIGRTVHGTVPDLPRFLGLVMDSGTLGDNGDCSSSAPDSADPTARTSVHWSVLE